MNGKNLRHGDGWIGLILAFLTASAFAGWEDIKAKEFSMSPPPKEGSAAYKKDFQVIHEYQDTRDSEACDLAEQMRFPTYKAYFADVLTKREYTAARDLVEKVMAYSIDVASYFKDKYDRPRPYVTDKTIKPCAYKPGGNKSYPSGHATSASATSCILAAIYPEKADEINEHGAYLGDLRVIVGVHHPSDVVAAQKLGAEICERLLAEDDFIEEMESLRQ